MSFDIFFQPCRYTGQLVEKRNAWTGKMQTVLVREPLTPAEVAAVERLLTQTSTRGPDKYGCWVVEFPDGGAAELFGKNLSQSCMVALRGMTPHLLRFLYDLLKAGKWVMLPAMEGVGAITTSPESLKGIPEDFPRIVVCSSVEELGLLLSKPLVRNPLVT